MSDISKFLSEPRSGSFASEVQAVQHDYTNSNQRPAIIEETVGQMDDMAALDEIVGHLTGIPFRGAKAPRAAARPFSSKDNIMGWVQSQGAKRHPAIFFMAPAPTHA